MSKYVLIILWFGLMALLQLFIGGRREEKVFGVYENRTTPICAMIIIFPLVWMAANRGTMADTHMYLLSFRNMPTVLSEMSEYMTTVTKDKGFSAVSVLIRVFLGSNEIIYLLFFSLIHGFALWFVYRKYSESYLMSIFLFMVSTDFISWMCNGLRQFTAVTIVFAATTLMLKKKYFPLILIILLASTMHQTALLMIPFVFIAQGKAWNKRTLLFTLIVFAAVLYVDQFTNILDSALYDTQYANVVSDWTSWNDDGTNPIRVLVYSVPAILAIIGYRHIREEDDPIINFCANMSVISTGLYLISMVTSGIFIGRLPIYASLYNYILLPWEINHFFSKKTTQAVKVLVIFFYLIFYYCQMHLTWGYI